MRVVLLITILALALSTHAYAQTSPSHRVRGLGEDLSGLVDDHLTNFFLNPGRVGEQTGSQAVLFNQVGRFSRVMYPGTFRQYDTDGIESQVLEYTINPVGGAVFAELGAVMLALSGEVSVRNDDRVDDDQSDRFSGGEIGVTQIREYATQNDHEFYLVNLDLGTKGDAALFGVRFQAEYTSVEDGDASVYLESSINLTDPSQLGVYFRSNGSQYRFEKLVTSASVGIARPHRVLSDLVVGVRAVRERIESHVRRLDFRDNDVDGDGLSVYLGSTSRGSGEFRYETDREYTGYGTYGRAHARLGDRFRTTLSLDYEHLDGDGTGSNQLLDETFFGSTDEKSAYDAAFLRDGSADSWIATASGGYEENILDNVLVVGAITGLYERSQLDELGSGEASVEFSGTGNPSPASYASPYEVTYVRTIETIRASVPVGLEWTPHRLLSIRVGATLYGRKFEDNRSATRRVPELSASIGQESLTDVEVRNVDLDTATGVTFSNGLTLNVNDRLIVDVFTRSASIDLARYAYLSARLRF